MLTTRMRAAWCCLVLLTVLAPAGSVGITAAPAESETALTAPRAGSGVSFDRRVQLETTTPPSRSELEPRRISAPPPIVAPVRQLYSSTIVVVASPRAPPA